MLDEFKSLILSLHRWMEDNVQTTIASKHLSEGMSSSR